MSDESSKGLLETTPILSWLPPETEIKNIDRPTNYEALDSIDKACAFILISMSALLSANSGASFLQLLDIVANSIVETGWGRLWRGWNFGGWKINKPDVKAYQLANNGANPPWWRALGHIASGDSPVVYYRGFHNAEHFYKEWIERFVPKNVSIKHRYYETGQAFWNKTGNWFLELCLAGYKGRITQANPDGSVQAHNQIVNRSKKIFAQFVLKAVPDGDWGPKSTLACKQYQKSLNLPETGILDDDLFNRLVQAWIDNGKKLNFKL